MLRISSTSRTRWQFVTPALGASVIDGNTMPAICWLDPSKHSSRSDDVMYMLPPLFTCSSPTLLLLVVVHAAYVAERGLAGGGAGDEGGGGGCMPAA